MKKIVYGTIIVFIIILIIVAIVAVNNAPKIVKYENGKIIQVE
ncbi:MAG: hypothetical protein ABFR36_03005 [Acidobacteriota bacterium]